MQFGATPEQDMIVETVRSFVEQEIYPLEDNIEKLGRVPKDIADDIKSKVKAMGFYAANFPEAVGGGGLNHVEFALLERELGRGSMALTHFFGRPQNILMACKGAQIERYLGPAVSGEKMDALAMTEPDAGSDVRSMTTAAKRDAGDWLINGTKHFISGGDHADFFIVFVATGVDETAHGTKKRITCFLVDRGHPGFSVLPGYQSVSHNGYPNVILKFENCRVPDDQVLGAVDGGFEVMNSWLYATRITVAAMAVGRARRPCAGDDGASSRSTMECSWPHATLVTAPSARSASMRRGVRSSACPPWPSWPKAPSPQLNAVPHAAPTPAAATRKGCSASTVQMGCHAKPERKVAPARCVPVCSTLTTEMSGRHSIDLSM